MQRLIDMATINTINKILAKIYGHGRGWVFSGKDFQGFGPRATVDSALHRLARQGRIRRIARGLYDYPRYSRLLEQQLSPDVDQAAQALARKFGWRLLATGAMAANLLGLSTQVPSQVVYLIDGPSKSFTIGETKIRFNHSALKDLKAKGGKSKLVIQALKHLGKNGVDRAVLDQLRRKLSDTDCRRLLRDARYGTDWIAETVAQICHEKDE